MSEIFDKSATGVTLREQSMTSKRASQQIDESIFAFFGTLPNEEKHKRRRTTLKEALVPCKTCGYPLSNRHHVYPVHLFGDNKYTLALCANCHVLYHLLESAEIHQSTHAQAKV